jgi:hypothetical protein
VRIYAVQETLIQAAGDRNKLDAERDMDSKEVEELWGGYQCAYHEIEVEGGQNGIVEG